MIVRTIVVGSLIPAIVVLGGSAEAKRARPIYQHITVNVYGCGNVIATGRSVLTIGARGPVNANTGDVSSGGVLGIAADHSSLRSGNNARFANRPPRDPGPGVAISGFEDHSVHVLGEDQMAVYDDSNLFVNRNGKLNGNTGDTDSSGLNAVDVTGSAITTGDHIEDGEEDDDDSDDKKKKAAAARAAGRRTRAMPLSHGRATSTVTDEGESGASGRGSLTIGGDGYDNLGVRLTGRRNIAAYDDSNVVIGGTGDVNAQIGDSDTSGAVVMGIARSKLRSGNST